jgi:glycosyl transferase family 25
MKVFVIHYKPLVERKMHILEQFRKHNIIDYEFIEIDRDELDGHDISMFQKNYSTSQMAISLSHFYAYKQISENYENGLIFEDDIILSDDFESKFKTYMDQLPENYDMLFLGDGCKLHIDSNRLIQDKHVYETSYSRCTDSYVVSKKGATQICEYINATRNINLPIDNWLNIPFQEKGYKIYWAEPTIVTQGTQNGTFVTSH